MIVGGDTCRRTSGGNSAGSSFCGRSEKLIRETAAAASPTAPCGLVYQLVGGRQLWRGKGLGREYLLAKLQEFHRLHKTPMEQTIRDLREAIASLPKSAYANKAKLLERSRHLQFSLRQCSIIAKYRKNPRTSNRQICLSTRFLSSTTLPNVTNIVPQEQWFSIQEQWFSFVHDAAIASTREEIFMANRRRSDTSRHSITSTPSRRKRGGHRRAVRRLRWQGPGVKRLDFEQLEARRLLAFVGGPEDDFASLPLPDYEEPAPAMDVTENDLAYAGPVAESDMAVELVDLDLSADPQLEDSGPLIDLDQLRSDPRFAGINGDGFGSSGPIGVAIVDTGIDTDHPYLNFAGGWDSYYQDPDPNDFVGHGTHVAGIVGSTHGLYTGVAPGVNLYGVKVFSDFGGSTPFFVIERGLQWVIDNAAANNIQV
ncbi:MAG: S8 family serine peptidase, partial [Planctomycetes bacterium]|nr:S8 family serine peptidase [Planctomycetota bacterium]